MNPYIFFWLNDQPEKLNKRALESCADPKNAIHLSLISLWEIQIKSQLGKLHISVPWQTMIQTQREENGLQILALSEVHIEYLGRLASHHRDPFDRMLIAQARAEKMVLVSTDSVFRSYDVALIG